MAKRVTQRDVAHHAGVSQATVSIVLNGGSSTIPQETLRRITAAARELGYEPNRFAQALRTNRSMTVAC
ncbi:MAG: LacI family DNA-binding transcriptional regulator, partial [Phyllobacterium sp.]